MTFDPRGFLDTARGLRENSSATSADHRTAANRAYYAAYGYVKLRCMQACPEYSNLEIEHHRPGELARRLSQPLARRWDRLREFREQSDYEFNVPIGSDEARQAGDHADKLIAALETAPPDFYVWTAQSIPEDRRVRRDSGGN